MVKCLKWKIPFFKKYILKPSLVNLIQWFTTEQWWWSVIVTVSSTISFGQNIIDFYLSSAAYTTDYWPLTTSVHQYKDAIFHSTILNAWASFHSYWVKIELSSIDCCTIQMIQMGSLMQDLWKWVASGHNVWNLCHQRFICTVPPPQ